MPATGQKMPAIRKRTDGNKGCAQQRSRASLSIVIVPQEYRAKSADIRHRKPRWSHGDYLKSKEAGGWPGWESQ